MAAVCPINLDRERLKAEVRATYAQVAENPDGAASRGRDGDRSRELYRVVRPGGRLQFADIVIESELSEDARNNIDFDTFRATSKEKVARKYGVRGANFIAYK